jgi:cytosine/adenosine deaminase-related metal-dependent hydrolase
MGIIDPRDKDIESMSIESAIMAHHHHHGAFGDRLHVWMAAGTPRGSPASAHGAIGEACKSYDIGLTMHCAEAPKDFKIYQKNYNCTPAQFCRDMHLAGRKTVLAHMVHLDLDTDLPILAETGTTVAHNPTSNCKLASGIAQVPEMVSKGVNVSLGTDGAPCSNTYDMFREMHLAGIIHKGASHDASLIGATKVLEMATINGALALGLGKDIGSLEVGKKADLVIVDPSGLHATPFDARQILDGGIDPVTALVYSCTGSDVDTVMVDGQVLVQKGKLITLDEEEVKKSAREVVGRIRSSSKVKAKTFKSWNYI